MKLFTTLTLALTLAVAPACSKKTNDAGAGSGSAPTMGSAMAGSADMASGSAMAGSADMASGSAMAGSAMAGSDSAMAAGSGSAAMADANADFISVYATHAKPKPDDPVEVKFQKFAVTKAAFDPKNLEGGTATVEIDLASLSSGSEKRDGHLKTPDYIDVSKFTTATVDLANVKKKGDDKHFTADAKVKLRDIEKTYPVEFEVLEAGADSVKIAGTHKFARADFKVGEEKPDQPVGAELEIKLRLTLKKT